VCDQGKRIEALDEHVLGQARWCACAVELGWWSRQMERPCPRVPHVEQPRVVLHGEAEAVVAKLLVRLAAAVELLDVAAVALEHGVAPRRRPRGPARGSASARL